MQEIDGSYVQYRSQCIEVVTFTCNTTNHNNCSTHVAMQEIDGSYVQYRSQCIEGVTFTCNGTQDNNCNDGDATIRQWQIAFYNFDNMASALLSVVEVAVMDNYMDDCAYFLMDATGITNCHAELQGLEDCPAVLLKLEMPWHDQRLAAL